MLVSLAAENFPTDFGVDGGLTNLVNFGVFGVLGVTTMFGRFFGINNCFLTGSFTSGESRYKVLRQLDFWDSSIWNNNN